MIPYALSMLVVLALFWLALSGLFTPLLLTLGALSSLAIVVLMVRGAVVDREGHPVHLLPRAWWYWPWLMWQILGSAVNVARIVLSPSLPISPTLIRVRATQRTSPGLATYANSIILTPGTLSVDTENDVILVHALTDAGADAVASNVMDRMVSRFESAPR